MSDRSQEVRAPGLAVGAVLWRPDNDGEVLLARRLPPAHAAGTWGACGGRVHWGERLGDAARREVFEEIGVEVVRYHLICFVNMVAYGTHWSGPQVVVTAWEGEPQLREPDRVESWGWWRMTGLPCPLFLPVRATMRLRGTQLLARQGRRPTPRVVELDHDSEDEIG